MSERLSCNVTYSNMLADAAQCITASAESLTDIERTINNPFFLLFETTIVKYTQRSSLTSLYVTSSPSSLICGSLDD